MLRTKPRLKYYGLTVILSNPSRFDSDSGRLLSATGGHLFNDHCLRPETNSMQIDVRIVQDSSPFLPDTKCVLLLGEKAMHIFLPETTQSTVRELRGSPFVKDGLVYIPSFLPQDAADLRDHESQLNPLSENYVEDSEDFSEETQETESAQDSKKLGKTSRSNYAFWLKADTKKALRVIKNSGKIPWTPEELICPIYRIYPPSDEIIKVLLTTKNTYGFFDIETDIEEQNLQCFSIKFDSPVVWCAPILDYNYSVAYSSYHHIMRALAVAIRDNTIIAHNGAAFDFLVLAFKYQIPVNKVMDTMLMLHRCFPDVEKSLGHGVSLWTNQQFHKSEDSEGYRNKDQMMKRLKYCGKDVWTMYLMFCEIQRYAKTIPGLELSIETANKAIRPYLITTLQGIRVDNQLLLARAQESDRMLMQLNRCINMMIGEKGLAEIRSRIKGKPKMFAGSSTQCAIYFHDLLGYKTMARSSKTGKASLGKKAMYKLALAYPDNPVIKFVLKFRKLQKEYSTYKFIPWKDDDDKPGKETIITTCKQ